MPRRRAPSSSKSNYASPLFWLVVVVVVITLVVGIFGLTGLINPASARTTSGVDFSLNDFSNKTVRLSDYRGKPVFVNLWASWCPPCRAEMPDLIAFYKAHQNEGLVFLAIDTQDTQAPAQQFINEKQMPFPVLFDPDGKVMRLFGASGLPSSYLIDRNGKIVFSWTGQISPAILDQRVVPLLSQ